MSGDGGVDGASCCSYTSSRKNLADDVEWLFLSLGMKVTRDERIPTYTYKGEKLKGQLSFRVCCTPTIQVFKLKRKADLLNFDCGQMFKRYHRMISKFEEIDPVPMRCITVDSPNGCYLTGKQLIPTSNTKVASEIIRYRAETGLSKNILLIAPTTNDVISTNLEGPSGLLSCCPPWNQPHWSTTYKSVTWPNKSRLIYRSGDEPERIRGVNADLVIIDELAAAIYGKTAFDMAMFALRLGDPKCIITTTPKPLKYLLEILQRKDCYTISGSSHENAANIDLSMILEQYEGTRLGQQEIYGNLLFDNPDALWSYTLLDQNRVEPHRVPELMFIVVAVDPAVSSSENSAETGITVAGYGSNGHIYILYSEGFKVSPNEWAQKVLNLYDHYRADKIIAEVNNGGDLVISNISNVRPLAPVTKVHASRGKEIRAEPVATLSELGKIHHVGYLSKLEQQMTNFPSPDKKALKDCLDSMVWAVTAIMEATASTQSHIPLVGGERAKLTNYLKRFNYR